MYECMDGYVDGLIYQQIDLMIYGVKDDDEGGGWMGRLVDGLIDRYIDGLVDGDDSIDVDID